MILQILSTADEMVATGLLNRKCGDMWMCFRFRVRIRR